MLKSLIVSPPTVEEVCAPRRQNTQAGTGASCVFNFGNDIPGTTTNDFGQRAQYGTTITNPYFPAAVVAPTLTKGFAPSQIPVGTTSVLTFTIKNSDPSVTITGVGFTDTLPTGVLVAGGVSNTCGGTFSAAGNSISLSGASLAGGASCTINMTVSASVAGVQVNTTTAIVSDQSLDGTAAAASLTVVAPPVISKAFPGPTVPLNHATTLTFKIVNPNLTASLSGVGFSDTLTSGMVVSTPSVVIGSCGAGTISAVANSTTISLTGGTIAANSSCTFSVTVTGTVAGQVNNTTTNVTSVEGGIGNKATASIIVVAPPVISKAFPSKLVSINVGYVVPLSFTITNPNTVVTLTGVGFTDTLPSGLVVATPNGLTGSCGGGAITAIAGNTTITLTGASLPATTSCTFSVNVLGINEGIQNNLTSQVNSIEGGLGNKAAARIIVGTALQVRYMGNLNVADSVVNLTSTGINGGQDPAGDICANVYVFAADQQLIECCTCALTPNHLMTLSGKTDLIANNLTPGVANGITVALLVTANPTGSPAACDASAVTAANLTVGLRAYGTTIHALPTGSYGVTETPFSPVPLSASELMKMDQFCGFIKANGSNFGICGSCKPGAAGAARR
jgi:hypothetical protein